MQLSVCLKPPVLHRLTIKNVDVSNLFYQLQRYLYKYIESNKLSLESDLPLFLSLSSILLLQNNNRMHSQMIPYFGNGIYSEIRQHNLKEWSTQLKFPSNAMTTIIDTVECVTNNETDRYSASAKLLTMASEADSDADKKLIASASLLVQFLPANATNEDVSESALTTRYIIPVLQPLFNAYEKNIRIEFTATSLAQCDKSTPNFNGYPDCIITIFPHQTDDGINIGYGEIKRSTMAGDHYLINWDLMRLAVFGKNAIDDNKLHGALGIHVVAPHITFYLIKLQADGLYTMTELARIQFPMSLMEVLSYITNYSQLKNVLHIFESLYTTTSNINDGVDVDFSTWRHDSLSTTDANVL